MNTSSTAHEKTVAVVGLGKIGLPLAVQYARHGWQVIGCDTNPAVVETVNAGRSHVHEEPGMADDVAHLVREGLLRATTDTTAATRAASVIVVIVPVLVDDAHQVDLTWMLAATRAIGQGLHAGALVSYETTLPVGTTSGLLRQTLEAASGLRAGVDFHLAYSPERVSSGVIFRDLATYPKVVGGLNAASLAAGVAFYSSVLDAPIIEMKSTDDAEFVKLIETTYRDVNIALANEYARFADAHGLDALTAIGAANTQPYSHIHQPGVGVGGHCIPVYPYFLISGDQAGEPTITIPRQARRINDGMAEYATQRIAAEIGALAGQTVLLLGVAYRGDVRETAFTSARLLQAALRDAGALAYTDDPLYSADELSAMGYTPLPASKVGQVRAIVVQAAHSAYKTIDLSPFTACRVVLDGRGALAQGQVEAHGMRYLRIGDGQQVDEDAPDDAPADTTLVASRQQGGAG
ncbi:MAG: nucleotide sugar dehydrogenase [Ktedonobacterales bacterium]